MTELMVFKCWLIKVDGMGSGGSWFTLSGFKTVAVTGSEEEEDVGGTIFMPASLGTNSGVFR